MEHGQDWTFLTPHGLALLHLARQPEATMREIANTIGVTERWAGKVVADLVDAGYVSRTRVGTGYRNEINPSKPLRHPLSSDTDVRQLLLVLDPLDDETIDLTERATLLEETMRLRTELADQEQQLEDAERRAARAQRALARVRDLAAGAVDA